MASPLDRAQAPAVGPPPAVALPAISRERLSNGLGLVLLPYHRAPVVELEVVVGAGSAHDPPGAAGLAHLTAHLLAEGAAQLGMLEIAERLAALGARLTVGCSYDAAHLRLTVLRSNVEAGLALLADLLRRPTFPGAEIERLLAEREVGLRQDQDNPAVVANNTFAAELFGPTHPYGAPEAGALESVHGLTRDAFLGFFRRAYHPDSATLLAVGDFPPDALRAAAAEAFGDWQPGAMPPADVSPPAVPGRGVVLVDRTESAQSELRVGHVGIERAHPDAFALTAANYVLGGAFTSRLNQSLRERRGWSYGARSTFAQRCGPGPFVVTAAVNTPETCAAVREIHHELDRMARGAITDAELSLAINGLTRSLPRQFETPAQIADRLRELVVCGLPNDYYATYQERFRALRRTDVERAAQTHIRPAMLLTAVVGDAIKIADELADLGPIAHRSWRHGDARLDPTPGASYPSRHDARMAAAVPAMGPAR
ncbi:MAG: M16 family metallopeptidase [Gemmatimonadota bacterium]